MPCSCYAVQRCLAAPPMKETYLSCKPGVLVLGHSQGQEGTPLLAECRSSSPFSTLPPLTAPSCLAAAAVSGSSCSCLARPASSSRPARMHAAIIKSVAHQAVQQSQASQSSGNSTAWVHLQRGLLCHHVPAPVSSHGTHWQAGRPAALQGVATVTVKRAHCCCSKACGAAMPPSAS